MSRKILKNHSKIKISISLHLSRNFIRSEPCFKWREVSLHGNRLISPIAAEAGELPKNGGEKVNDSSQLQGLPPSISDWARARTTCSRMEETRRLAKSLLGSGNMGQSILGETLEADRTVAVPPVTNVMIPSPLSSLSSQSAMILRTLQF